MTTESLAGMTAVVTGGSRGIGRSIAVALAERGSDVVVGLRSEQSSTEVLDEIRSHGVRALGIVMDATDLDALRDGFDRAVDHFGQVDMLVNNAGGGINADALGVAEADFDALCTLNPRSPFFLSQHAPRHMSTRAGGRGGAIVN